METAKRPEDRAPDSDAADEAPPPSPPAPPAPKAPLPFLRRYPVIAGALAGVLLRWMFSGLPGTRWDPMIGAFVYGAPLFVGMATVYLAERVQRRSWWYCFSAPLRATALFVTGTLLVNLEGLICAVLIVPFFAVIGAAGGLLMGLVCRLTGWPTSRNTLYGVGALPLALAAFGVQLPAPHEIGMVEYRVHMRAVPDQVWPHVLDTPDIPQAPMNEAWAMRIGVPPPRSSVMTDTPQGRVRRARWGKAVYFDEVIEEFEPARRLRWTYRFHEDSVPAGALDDHVRIGGHYFDLLDTQIDLIPADAGTDVRVRTRYRISTQFNFYADGWARWLMGDFSERLMDVIRQRAEAAARRPE